MRVSEGPILPHQNFGDPECCGTLWGLIWEDQPDTADIVCNECDTVVKTVAASALQRTLDQMELTLCTATWPHCGKVNLFTGFSEMLAYTCRECGMAVKVSEDK